MTLSSRVLKMSARRGGAAAPAKKRRDERAHYARAERTFFYARSSFSSPAPNFTAISLAAASPIRGARFSTKSPFRQLDTESVAKAHM